MVINKRTSFLFRIGQNLSRIDDDNQRKEALESYHPDLKPDLVRLVEGMRKQKAS